MGEHYLDTVGVTGSIPVSPTTTKAPDSGAFVISGASPTRLAVTRVPLVRHITPPRRDVDRRYFSGSECLDPGPAEVLPAQDAAEFADERPPTNRSDSRLTT